MYKRQNQDYAVLAPFKTLNYSLKGIYDMEFFKYRFGKIPRSEFDKFESYLDPDMDEIFLTCLVAVSYTHLDVYKRQDIFCVI